MKVHQFCALFPDIDGDRWNEFKASIAENGAEPIWQWGNQILDGKNRLRACEELGIKPTIRQWVPPARDRDGAAQDRAALEFVLMHNLHRRDLDQSQRAMIAAEVANLRKSQKKSAASIEASQADAAEKLDVSRASVQRAAEVKSHSPPEVINAIKSGDVTVSDAAAVSREPPAKQRAAVKAVKAGKAKTLRAAVKPSVKGFDDSQIQKAIDVLVRLFDKRANALNCKGSRGHKASVAALSETLKEFKAWQKVR